jgi:DNA replication protein DnaC
MHCERCGDIGLVRTERGTSAPCPCQVERGAQLRIQKARIPAGFAQATLENFEPKPHTRPALMLARRYAEEFPPDGQAAAGLLLSGSVGTGKTHLAAAIVQALARRGFQPLFVDIRDLLDRLRRSYDDKAAENAGEIMAPIVKADLVVIDELGASRPTDWVFDTVDLLIGGLYNRLVPTIVTTNFPNQGEGEAAASDYARAARRETLCDRIGARSWSRLQQMCRPLDMTGPDWRMKR